MENVAEHCYCDVWPGGGVVVTNLGIAGAGIRVSR